jgi:hypothetical protein
VEVPRNAVENVLREMERTGINVGSKAIDRHVDDGIVRELQVEGFFEAVKRKYAGATMRVIDGDGHVMENWQDLVEYMPEAYREIGRFAGLGRLFPPLDHLHTGTLFLRSPRFIPEN